jgi:hypothetical protein
MVEKKHQLTALGIAYEAVIKLGYIMRQRPIRGA